MTNELIKPHHLDELARRLTDSEESEFAPKRRRVAPVVTSADIPAVYPAPSQLPPPPTSDEFRRNAVLVADGIQQLQDSERALRLELSDARARIEQYQRAEHEYKLKIEGAQLDVECERRRTEKVREAFTALRVRMEGLGRLAADALAELREDET